MFFTRLQVICSPDVSEILMAELAEAGFDTFMETEKGFEAYGEDRGVNLELIEDIKTRYRHLDSFIFFIDKVKKENWNSEWEKNVEPIFIDDQCLIRAEFHRIEKKFPYEIIITPKMSFGTGHHQTTYLMVRGQLSVDHSEKRVMDAGCGTAILSIMACKRGAKEVEAFDIDEWSVTNGQENAENNQCSQINIRQGKIRDLSFTGSFDIILANINKNILLDEMEVYNSYLNLGGVLMLSGFYTADIPELLKKAGSYGLSEVKRDEKETWAMLLLQKVSA